VHLDWSADAGAGPYVVKRSTSWDFSGASSIAAPLPGKSYDDPVLANGTDYAHRIFRRTLTDGLSYYHVDHLGTPLAMTDAAGSLTWRAEHYPFGGIYSATGTATNDLRFPGQYADAETGYHQNWHRDYVPWLGRYAEVDPLGLFGEDRNLYGYVLNQPGSFTDASGESGGKGSPDSYDGGKTVCDGCGGFEWVWRNKFPRPPCAQDCIKAHEEDHIDWFKQNRPDACNKRAEGANPDIPPADVHKTECRAYKVSFACFRRKRLMLKGAASSSCRRFLKAQLAPPPGQPGNRPQRYWINLHCKGKK